MKIATIETTFSKRGEADEIVRRLIEERFVATAQLERISSSFNWKGVERSIDEWKVSFKTTIDRREAAVERLEGLHSYETPMILWSEQETTEAYGAWLEERASDESSEENDYELDENSSVVDERELDEDDAT